MNRYVRALVAAASAVVLAAAIPSPASAGDGTTWPSAKCLTGGFTGHLAGISYGWPRLELSGWAGPCADGKDSEALTGLRFGFAYYPLPGATMFSAGRVYSMRLRSFGSPTGPTQFEGAFDFSTAMLHDSPDMPICLMRDLGSRVACVVVRLDGDSMPTVAPLAVDDPRVSNVVVYATDSPGEDKAPTPNCGWCL
jgi:hypothetical protein